MHTLVLGAGFSGRRIAELAAGSGSVCATRTTAVGVEELNRHGIPGLVVKDALSPELYAQLAQVTHLVVSVAPARDAPLNDPLLNLMGHLTRKHMPALQWLGYLSTIGVYGNHDGRWVDETTPCTSTQMRSVMRREAEIAWEQFGDNLQVPVSVLRLSGIYGPGRNAVQDALNGRAHMLIKPDQVFNRIHVHDLAQATLKAGKAAFAGVLNISDDLPAPPQDIITFAHELVGKPAPEAQDFDRADISPMARSFYSENKRVKNQLGKSMLGIDYQYPTYKEGLTALWMDINERLKT